MIYSCYYECQQYLEMQSDVLALSVEILDEVLQKVGTFLHFDFVHFQEILQRQKRVKPLLLTAVLKLVTGWCDLWPLRDLTSHIWSWKIRRSFSISSAISPPLNSVRIIPCCLACSLFSFSIFVLQRSKVRLAQWNDLLNYQYQKRRFFFQIISPTLQEVWDHLQCEALWDVQLANKVLLLNMFFILRKVLMSLWSSVSFVIRRHNETLPKETRNTSYFLIIIINNVIIFI